MTDCRIALAQVEKKISPTLRKEDNWIGIQWRSESGQRIDRVFCDFGDPSMEAGWRIFLQHYYPSPQNRDEFELHVAPFGIRVFRGGHCVKMRRKRADGTYTPIQEFWPENGSSYFVDEPDWEYALHIPRDVEAYTLVVRGPRFSGSQESGTYEMFEPLDQETRWLIFDVARRFYGA